MEGYSKWWTLKLVIAAVIIILARLYTTWDTAYVIAGLLIIKAILVLLMPMCCKPKVEPVVKKRR